MSNQYKKWITNSIVNYCLTAENSIRNAENDPAWAEPLVGFTRGDDPIFEYFKKDIGEFFWLPLEIFKLTFNEVEIQPSELTIISWILPQTKKTIMAHRNETQFPSEAWARSRYYGEEFNIKLARHVISILKEKGYIAVAPGQSRFWSWQKSERYGFASNWSERHIAHACGLGTFGLCDGLITSRGKAFRCGSVISNIPVSPTRRDYKNHTEYCLFFSDGTCGKCIERCPVNAISKMGHDKNICEKYLFNTVDEYSKINFGFSNYSCGLCQTGVPCESQIPNKKHRGTETF